VVEASALCTQPLQQPILNSAAEIFPSLTMVDFDPRFEIMPGTKARETEVTGYVESGIDGKTIATKQFRFRPSPNSNSSQRPHHLHTGMSASVDAVDKRFFRGE
jgi:hypothetical protein